MGGEVGFRGEVGLRARGWGLGGTKGLGRGRVEEVGESSVEDGMGWKGGRKCLIEQRHANLGAEIRGEQVECGEWAVVHCTLHTHWVRQRAPSGQSTLARVLCGYPGV